MSPGRNGPSRQRRRRPHRPDRRRRVRTTGCGFALAKARLRPGRQGPGEEHPMINKTIATAIGGALLLAASSASAQPAPPPPLAIPNPMYITMVLEVSVDKPAAEVWSKIGKFCDIADWLQTQCALTGGDYQ